MTELTYFERLFSRGKMRTRNLAGEVVPSWQIGMEQPNPQDVANFISEGYAKNSLIFACIHEKATAFSPLRARVLRPGSNGTMEEMKRHPLVMLLDDPNPFQSRAEFQEMLSTHMDAAGNVYIHMMPEASTPDRRMKFRGMAVQELQIIRPDYVTIEPGPRRMDDVFRITVEGQLRARIPRSQIIHIKTANPLNDFYGLSPITLLVREGNIDLKMSDFELAFYNNAGVPAGILNVNGPFTREQAEDVKTRFRQAYNGVKKWFDLLVLNAQDVKYQQLGLPMNQLEMEGSRFHAETRICAVFGVPPGLVHARAAMFATAHLSPMVDMQFQFWTETMVPFADRVASSYEKQLLPKLNTSAGRSDQVLYDYSVVRALQEDRSLKLREVVRMMGTGGFTVDQALELVGLPGIGADFYVRQLNQVEVTREMDGSLEYDSPPQTNDNTSRNPDNPLEGAARLRRERVQSMERHFARLPVRVR